MMIVHIMCCKWFEIPSVCVRCNCLTLKMNNFWTNLLQTSKYYTECKLQKHTNSDIDWILTWNIINGNYVSCFLLERDRERENNINNLYKGHIFRQRGTKPTRLHPNNIFRISISEFICDFWIMMLWMYLPVWCLLIEYCDFLIVVLFITKLDWWIFTAQWKRRRL